MADTGYYTCTAKNRVGTDIKVVSVIVTGRSTNSCNFNNSHLSCLNKINFVGRYNVLQDKSYP